MNIKLIFYVFLFLIFINSSNGKKCKCPSKQTKNPLFHRRVKRGFCSCLGGGGATDDDFESYRNPEKRPMTEEMQAGQTQRKGKKAKRDMLVYTDTEGVTIESDKFQIIPVPINEETFLRFQVKNIVEYRNGTLYSTMGIYSEIITNQNGILDWLQQNKYDIGIAEFGVMAGSFAVFEALGIEETCDVSSSVFLPIYLQFLGINVLDYQVPEYKSAKPGDWEDGNWQKNREENIKEHKGKNEWACKLFNEDSIKYYNKLFNDKGISRSKLPSLLVDLFNNIKYHFINQHPLIKFDNFPDQNKIVYIGGITVEDDKLLTEEKQLADNELKDYTESLGAALYQILNIDEEGNFNFNSKYSLAAEKMRNEILQNYKRETMKDKFLGKFDGTN
uniref:Glucuronosyltransferase n=1 Tax=Meloidogyne floridensis TaxID=298350 RepID=A0A915PCD1_9BILA